MRHIESESLEIFFDPGSHELSALLEKSVVVERGTVQKAFRYAVHREVFLQLVNVRDAAILFLSAVALVNEGFEIDLGRLIADGDVDLGLLLSAQRQLKDVGEIQGHL